jgi:feruloyl esterase
MGNNRPRTGLLSTLCVAVVLSTLVLWATPGLASPSCTAADAQAAAPSGMTIGPISDLNASLPPAPTGAVLVPASSIAPEYCLITGTVVTNPATIKTANFGMALPPTWNGKFLYFGCGGLCGTVFSTLPVTTSGGGAPADALAKGYAIAATDDGHAGAAFNGSWALISPGVPNTDAVTDFFYRAVHVVANAGKSLSKNWYGASDLAQSYYYGCSDGGREGLVEASRYPADFDGYVAGDPFMDIRGEILAGSRATRNLTKALDSFIPADLLAVVDSAVAANCDATDGVTDGLIQNAGKCSFKPERLLCQGDNATSCLTQNQVDTLTQWISAARNPDQRVVSYGYPVSDLNDAPGLNLFAWAESAGPPLNINAAEPWGTTPSAQPPGWAFSDQMLKYFVYLDPDFDSAHNAPVDFNGLADPAAVALIDRRTEAGDGDVPQKLEQFVGQNRKMILFHGYSDGWINPFRTIGFYQEWAKIRGDISELQDHARLFMVPGMFHCQGGPGPNTFDTLKALEHWVENGIAPDSIVATKYTNDDQTMPPLRTMPLCKFPQQAQYSGSGDVNSAANWSCTANQDLLQVGLDGALAGQNGPPHRPGKP